MLGKMSKSHRLSFKLLRIKFVMVNGPRSGYEKSWQLSLSWKESLLKHGIPPTYFHVHDLLRKDRDVPAIKF